MRDLRNGVKLKKVQERQFNPLPIEYQLTPYEMLMDDIRSKRYTLRKVMVRTPQKKKAWNPKVSSDEPRRLPISFPSADFCATSLIAFEPPLSFKSGCL